MDLRHTTCTWSSPKFLITYNLNGGSNSGSSLNVHELKESGEFLNDGATLNNTGFVFAGWNTASDGSGTNYPIVSNQIPFTPPTGKNHIQSHTLYAMWQSNASPQLDPANSCNVTATNIKDVINAQVISGANKYRFNISYDNDPANDIPHVRGNISSWTQLFRINGQLPSTHPLKNKMEYFGREYSVTVDASFNNTWTTGTTTCTWSSPKFLITYNLNGCNSCSSLLFMN